MSKLLGRFRCLTNFLPRRIDFKFVFILIPVLIAAGCGKFFVSGNTLVAIAVTPSNPSVQAGQTQQFAANGTDANGATITVSSPMWTSSATNIATINSSGLATVLATASNGSTTTITASASGVSGSTVLTVGTASSGGLTISCTGCSGQGVGTFTAALSSGSITFIATSSGTIISPTWSSSNVSVANIGSSTGLATLVAAGTTTITAQSGSATGSVTLTVQ
jgi:hypothetical protein